MNKEEILAMEAGKELDCIVAKKVMGWEAKPLFAGCRAAEVWRPGNQWIFGWKPSTDISAAWQVVEKMEQGCDEIHIEWRKGFGYMVCFGHPGAMLNFPICEAICKAALLAICSQKKVA